MGMPLPAWEPAVWEATSVIALIALAWVAFLMVERFPPVGPRWPFAIAAHIAVTIPFSLVHVALMVFLRHGFYALLGESYDFGPGFDEVLYEIGRASCRESGCQYGVDLGGRRAIKK